MDIVMIGIDVGKNLCSVACPDAEGRVALRRRMRRETVVVALANKLARIAGRSWRTAAASLPCTP